MSAKEFFDLLVATHKAGVEPRGICSVCSAHPIVIEAAFLGGEQGGGPVLVESTANQVNQEGGYTGATPERFRRALLATAQSLGFPSERLIVGGDHLGPYPWRSEPAASAMAKARALVESCIRAGYQKIHLDASMPLGGDVTTPLDPRTIADREAELAGAGEAVLCELRGPRGEQAPIYVLGTEVPAPGGIASGESSSAVSVTGVEDLETTFQECRRAFRERGLEDAWSRVRALVAQPGVEFGDDSVHPYDRAAARDLCAAARALPGVALEGHSTDYQREAHLRELVEDGVAILKVGPGLTFAVRECLFSLERVERELFGGHGDVTLSNLAGTLEAAMIAESAHWRGYYRGSAEEQRLARRYSLSDRIRYYWNVPAVSAACGTLVANLSRADIPRPLVSQFLPAHLPAVLDGRVVPRARELARESVRMVLDSYARAARTSGHPL
jgi:D-tagatose-bisphosphate aldolase class II non-catalytic subunit